MKRLTEKEITKGTIIGKWFKDLHAIVGASDAKAIYLKLKQFEDIEEKYSIDLIKLLQALDNNGAYFIHVKSNFQKEIVFSKQIRISSLRDGDYFLDKGKKSKDIDNYTWRPFWIESYGKTWALTKEELENGGKPIEKEIKNAN